MVQLLELLWGELGLCRAAAAEDAHGLSLVLGQGLVDIIGDLGDLELIAGLGQDAGDVKAHIATPMTATSLAERSQSRSKRGLPS